LVTGRLTVREHDGKLYWGIDSDAVAVVRSRGATVMAGSGKVKPVTTTTDPWASAPATDSAPF
jgi:hypothetical protein